MIPTIESYFEFANNLNQSNGEKLEVDDVIFATGYRSDPYSFIEDERLHKLDNPNRRCLWQWYPVDQEVPSLFCIDQFYNFGLLCLMAELQAAAACGLITGKLKLPSKEEMEEILEKEEADSMRDFNQPVPVFVSGSDAAIRMAKFAGFMPNWEEIAQKDPELAEICKKGPILPQYFRLSGPYAKGKCVKYWIERKR